MVFLSVFVAELGGRFARARTECAGEVRGRGEPALPRDIRHRKPGILEQSARFEVAAIRQDVQRRHAGDLAADP